MLIQYFTVTPLTLLKTLASTHRNSVLCEPQGNMSWSDSSSEDHHLEDEEEELFSRTILNTSHETEEEAEVDKEDTEGKRRTEPTIVPTSPRHQIHSVIIHLQEGQRWVSQV